MSEVPHSPRSAISWGPIVQTHEPVRGVSQTTAGAYNYDFHCIDVETGSEVAR